MNLKPLFCSCLVIVIFFPTIASDLFAAPGPAADVPSIAATAQAVKSGLVLACTENFKGPDGKNSGVGWTQAAHYGVVNERILHHQLYFEITLRRLSLEGGLGVELFDSDQLRVGSDLVRGASALMAWNGTTWVPIAFDKQGSPLKLDWNVRHTIGVRFDSADGHHAHFSYYLDGRYVGSWTVNRAETELDKIGVYAQSKTSNARFEFSDLKVYTGPRS